MDAARHSVKIWLPVLIGLALVAGLVLPGMGRDRPGVLAAGCWQAEITEQTVDTDLAGSVLRVSVQGQAGLPVYVRSLGGFETVNFTGTKPEYGPFVAEYAPLDKGTYFIQPQGLGIVFEIWLDGKSYNRVEFRSVSCAPTATPTATQAAATPTATRAAATATARPTATTAALPTATPGTQPAAGWRGRVVEHIEDLAGRYYATIDVRIIGRPAGQEVEIRSGSWSATCKTGTKPEIAPDACEFGALNAGTYRLTPKDLGTQLDVSVGLQDYVLVEFYYVGPPANTRWVGSLVENTSGSQPTEHSNSAIAVIVAGKPWYEVEIRTDGWSTTCQTGYKPEYGPDACEFGGLRAGTFTITPKDLGASVQVTMDGWGWAMVRFDEVAAPPPQPPTATPTVRPTAKPTSKATATPTTKPTGQPTSQPTGQPTSQPTAKATGQPTGEPTARTGWQGWIIRNTSGQGGTGSWSVIVVRVINYGGVPVHITGGGDWSDTCITGTKPEYGPDACEFGGLWAATYTVRPEGSDLALEVTMDGLGTAELHFAKP